VLFSFLAPKNELQKLFSSFRALPESVETNLLSTFFVQIFQICFGLTLRPKILNGILVFIAKRPLPASPKVKVSEE
jgi:hypothetical protein